MSYYIGLDGGSTYLKATLLKDRQVVETMVSSSGIDNNGSAEQMLDQLCRKVGITRSDIRYTMATGYSRKVLTVADDDISEITAHAYGVRVTAPREYRPGMIIDIGGQDSKIIYLDSGYNIKNFTMNDKCAAGTGKFMEVAAQILETTIGIFERFTVIDHSGNINPVTAVIKLRLSTGAVIVKRDIQKPCFRIGGTNAADPVIANGDIMLNVDRIGRKVVRQGQDLICIVGETGRRVGAGGGERASGYTKLVQIDGAGGLYEKLICGRFSEGTGADQITVDEVVKIAAGKSDPHGYPLIFVAIVREVSKDVLRGRPAIFLIYIVTNSPIMRIEVNARRKDI